MRVFLTGVSCVGKTTIGRKLSKLLGLGFFDVDEEIEVFFGTSIERLQNRFITMHSFHEEAAQRVKLILEATHREVPGHRPSEQTVTGDARNLGSASR